MERGSGNRVKKAYGRRSPLREPISTIISIVSAIAGAANRSNKKAQAHGERGVKAGLKTKKFSEAGGGAKTTAGTGSLGAGAAKVKPMSKI